MTQQQAIAVLKLGFNVFLTGAAGSGKTYVLNEFIAYLRKSSIPTGITASTGIAATHIGGMTIHSWSGIGIREHLSNADIDRLLSQAPLMKRLRQARVLIIDEASMLHGARLDAVDSIMRAARDDERPFGGVQVVLCGDLFQLPPVTRQGDTDWVFNAQVWQKMQLKICYLHEQHRQSDSTLLDILNAIRSGEVEEGHYLALNDRMEPAGEQVLTRLFTHNADVERINNQQLKALASEEQRYLMEATGSKKNTETLRAGCLAPEELLLKIGAEVMFVANSPAQRYVNGTRGTVVAFTDGKLPVVVTKDKQTIVPEPFAWQLHDGEKKRAEIRQLPLRLAWAITVHKSQGMSLDAAEIDLSRAFEPGMGYVALSRVRDLSGLYIKGANSMALEVHPDIRAFDTVLRRRSGTLVQLLEEADQEEIARNQQQVRQALSPASKSQYDPKLFAALRQWRIEVADKKGVPAFLILADKTLQEIARSMPSDEALLGGITGIGPKKLSEYGAQLLVVIRDHDKTT